MQRQLRYNILLNYYNNRAYEMQIPVTVVMELLTVCNLKCEHCYLPAHNNLGMDTNKTMRLIKELRDFGVVSLLLTGGEIFLREDIFEIIKYARQLHMRVTLLSNATLLDHEKVDQLAELFISEFSTTIFSLQPDVNDSITTVPGSLQRIMANVQLLKESGIRVKIKMPLMKKNADSFDQVKIFCEENGFDFMPTFSISSKLDGERSPQNLRVDTNCLSRILDKMSPQNASPGLEYAHKEEPCPAIMCSFSIDCNGNVFPCNTIPYNVGNVNDSSVSIIWNESPKLKMIQGIRKDQLSECVECKYEPICNRCPGMALLEGDGLFACDPISKQIAQAKAMNMVIGGQ